MSVNIHLILICQIYPIHLFQLTYNRCPHSCGKAKYEDEYIASDGHITVQIVHHNDWCDGSRPDFVGFRG